MFATYRLPPNYSGQCSSALEEEDRNVYNSYLLIHLLLFFNLLTHLLTGTCTLPTTSGFPLSSLLLPAFSISQGESLPTTNSHKSELDHDEEI